MDCNPYLGIAASLACGYLGMEKGLKPSEPVEGSAYDLPYAMHRGMYAALEAFEGSRAMRRTLGERFVTLYGKLKHSEYMEFEEIVTPWERQVLMFNV